MTTLVAAFILASPRPLSSGELPPVHKWEYRELVPLQRSAVRIDPAPRCQVVATAYTANDPGMDGRGITAAGTRVREHHTLAVDPEVIPLGSWVYVPYFKDCPNGGWFLAEDTGGAIKGLRIDVYMPVKEEALKFGVKTLEIYVLKPRTVR